LIEKQNIDIASYIQEYQLDQLVPSEKSISQSGIYDSVNPNHTNPFPADWNDLVRLHQLVLSRKATTILEFGIGKSTVILADALKINRQRHGQFVVQHLRRGNAFELHSIDANKPFIKQTKNHLPPDLLKQVTFYHSDVLMSEFNGRICTLYKHLPNICPDFIYLDAPDQFCAKGDIRKISTTHPDRLPMSGDLLTIEHFLLPGTFILIDGRTANARFLQCNFQRNWKYEYFREDDIHTFELVEYPLGKFNKAQIEYCLGKEWLQGVGQ